jgi:hypothetical protein
MFPSLESHQVSDLENLHWWIKAIGIGVVVIACAAGLWWNEFRDRVSDRITFLNEQEESKKEAQEKAALKAELQSQIDAVIAENRAFVLGAKGRASLLTRDVQIDLLKRFKQLPPKSVAVSITANAQETADVGTAISNLLSAGGALLRTGISGDHGFGPGILIRHNGDKPGPSHVLLSEALVKAGFPGVRFMQTDERLPGDAEVHVAFLPQQ